MFTVSDAKVRGRVVCIIWKCDGAIEVDNSAAERDADAIVATDPVGRDAEASTWPLTVPRTEAQNGFANRCLWTWVQRSNCLPEGGNLSVGDLSPVAGELRRALDWAAAAPEILFRRDAAARDLWQERYPALSQLRPGLRGAATSRAEAQVLRPSAIYAALDSTSVIGLPHLQAALAVWDYCYSSASLLLGVSTGDPIADRIREAIQASNDGLSKSQIRRLFHGHVEGSRIDAALEKLVTLGALYAQSEATGGRPSTLWSVIEENEREENEESRAEEEDPAEDQYGLLALLAHFLDATRRRRTITEMNAKDKMKPLQGQNGNS